MSDILEDFFNVKTTISTDPVSVSQEFKPSARKGQGGVYKAVVRFLPNPEDPSNKSIVAKNTVWLENPLTNEKMEVDCPTSVGQPSILQNTFFSLRNSSNPVLQENSKKFSRRQRYASLIQVISCDSEPALVNKILVWRYGFKVHEKIAAELNPPMVPQGGPKNPFDLFRGRPFSIVVKEVSGYNNFDACAFFDADQTQCAMRMVINDAAGTPQIYTVTPQTTSTPEGRQMVFNYLKENAPSLAPYDYHEWDEKTTNFVNSCIQIYSNPQATLNAMAAQQNPGTPINAQAGPAATPNFSAAPSNNFAMPQVPTFTPTPAANIPTMATPAPATTIPAPTPSFQMGVAPSAVAQADPRGFNGTELPSSINDIMSENAAPAASAAPAAVPSLDDLLNNTMV